MTNLIETPVYETGIFQLETTTPVVGGQPGFSGGVPVVGHSNAQAQQLANRTAFLKNDKISNADLLSTSDITKGDSLVGVKSILTGATSRTQHDKNSDVISATDFGLVSGLSLGGGQSALDNANFLQASINALPRGAQHFLPTGRWVISRPIIINKGFIDLDWQGELVASDDFVGEYMVQIIPDGVSANFYRSPVSIASGMFLNCRYKTRGLYAYAMDHEYWADLRVEAANGRGIHIDRMRESCLAFPLLVNCAHRNNFTDPANWSSVTSYTAGQYVRIEDDAWSNVTAYVRDDIRRDGAGRYICMTPDTGSQPSLFPLIWKKIPHEDYLCVIANSNKPPQSNNTNSATALNRVWQKAYQDEAALEIVDYTIDGGDRSNQIVLLSPVVRDCGNKCFLRVDSSKLPSRPVTHTDVFGGHFHGLAAQQAGIVPELPIPDLQRCIEIGYAINTNIYASNIRCGDGNDCIAVMYGDGSTTKVSQDLRIHHCALSGDGLRDIGMLVMPSTQASLSAVLDVSFLMTDATSTNMHDPRRVMRKTFRTESRMLLPTGLNGVVGGYTILAPTSPYSDVRPYSYQVDGEVSTRYDVQFTSGRSTSRLGGGDNNYVEIQWNSASPNRMQIAPNKEAAVTGTFQFPLLLGTLRLWNNAGVVYVKNNSNPTSITDGIVLGTQT